MRNEPLRSLISDLYDEIEEKREREMKKEDNEGIAGKQEFHTIASNKKKGGGGRGRKRGGTEHGGGGGNLTNY